MDAPASTPRRPRGSVRGAPFLVACLLLLLGPRPPHAAHGHGYLATPRSRNLRAYEDLVWWPQTDRDPEPETCPHCLNRGGPGAVCGATGGRSYDAPRNALGGPLAPRVQANYTRGQDVVLDVTVTAHHKGHFVFSACPIAPGERPAPECFDRHPLAFVEDLRHGAPRDPRHPDRAYLAPVADPDYAPDVGNAIGVAAYSFRMRLPPALHGDLVLLRWYYLTANSCYHEGYPEYAWPAAWNMDLASGPCGDVSADGSGVPEQFWNCAEVRIAREAAHGGAGAPPSLAPPRPAPAEAARPVQNAPLEGEMSSGIAIPVGLPLQVHDGNRKPSSAGSHGKTIVGYYASWQWYDRNKKAAPENMDFTKVQRVNFAFFQIDVQGNVWGTDAWADPNLLFGPYDWNGGDGSKEYCSWDGPAERACNHHNYERGLLHLVHAAGAEIYPSLGGWTLSDPFPAMAASAAARTRFARQCVDLILEYGFDGIDIDWEYPGYADHSGTPQDTANFRLLLDDVRAELDGLGEQTGKFYGLTAALPCGPQHIANMDIAHVASTLSELNLMTYDFHGAWSDVTGANAPMYYQGWGEDGFDVHSCVENWLAGGGRRDKINIGLPFYGRSVSGATGLNQPHGGADQTVWGIDDGTPQYFNIVAQLPSMTTVWDKGTWTPYAFFESGGFVSYDDENAICVKVQYAIEHELGGFIIWELSGDVMDNLQTPLLDVTNHKLHNPDFNCGEPGFYPEEEEASIPVAPGPSPANQAPAVAIRVPLPALPTPPFPTANTPGSYPSEPSVEENVKPIHQPADDQPSNNQPMSNQPTYEDANLLFLCGEQQGTFNIADANALDLSFRYEVHRKIGVSVADAIKELKRTMLNGIAHTLNCAEPPSAGRLLRSNPVETSQENIMAFESTQAELPENDMLCMIPVPAKLYGSAVCHSVIGSITAYFEKNASAEVLREVARELFFYIRTHMSSGYFESETIKKVIYVEQLNASFQELKKAEPSVTPLSTSVVWLPQSEDGGGSSLVIAIVLSLLLVFFIGFNLLAFVARENRLGEEHAITTERASATDTEEIWKNALNCFSSEKETHVLEALRETSFAEPSIEKMVQGFRKVDKMGARSQLDYQEPSEYRTEYNSPDTKKHEDKSHNATTDTVKKRKTQEMNEILVNEKMLLYPDEGTQGSDGGSFEGNVDEPDEGRHSSDSDTSSFEEDSDEINDSTEFTIGDWTAYEDNDGMIYYHNDTTGESSWDPPPGFGDGNTTNKSLSEDLVSVNSSDANKLSSEDLIFSGSSDDGEQQEKDSGSKQKPLKDDGAALESTDDEEKNKAAEDKEAGHQVNDVYEQSRGSAIIEETTYPLLDDRKDNGGDTESPTTNTIEGVVGDHSSGFDCGADCSKAGTSNSPLNTTNAGSSDVASGIDGEIPDNQTDDEYQRLTSADYGLD